MSRGCELHISDLTVAAVLLIAVAAAVVAVVVTASYVGQGAPLSAAAAALSSTGVGLR